MCVCVGGGGGGGGEREKGDIYCADLIHPYAAKTYKVSFRNLTCDKISSSSNTM